MGEAALGGAEDARGELGDAAERAVAGAEEAPAAEPAEAGARAVERDVRPAGGVREGVERAAELPPRLADRAEVALEVRRRERDLAGDARRQVAVQIAVAQRAPLDRVGPAERLLGALERRDRAPRDRGDLSADIRSADRSRRKSSCLWNGFSPTYRSSPGVLASAYSSGQINPYSCAR